jgi:hypothetical protein
MTNANHVMFHKLLYKTGFSDKSYRWFAKDNYKYFRKLGFGIGRAINETDHALYQWYNSNGRYSYRSIYND